MDSCKMFSNYKLPDSCKIYSSLKHEYISK